jgi:hypothetical protein
MAMGATGCQFKSESENEVGPLSFRSAASAGAPWDASGRGSACLTRRPGIGVIPSARLGSLPVDHLVVTVGPSAGEQGCGASSQGQLGLTGTWSRATGSRPARSQVPPISREERQGGSRSSAGLGAVRQSVPGGHELDGVRVGLLALKAAGDPSSWTPVVSATVWPRALPGSDSSQLPSHSSGPQLELSSHKFKSHRSAQAHSRS